MLGILELLKHKLENQSVVILGFGREGQASYSLFRRIFPEKKLAVADLRALVAQLPQMPEDERLRREKMQEHIKKAREKEKELRKSGAKLDTLALSKEEKEKARKMLKDADLE